MGVLARASRDVVALSCLQGFSKIRLYFQDRRATRRGVNSARAARPRRAVRELRKDSGHGRDARARPRTTLRPRIDPCARRSGAAISVNRFFLTKFTTFLTENYKNNSKTSDNTPKIDDKYDKISHLKFTHF